ncbi:putative gustatory receptor 2a [Anopheles cruzii]|uniref:putative gustatory receptor 2a n=1 Tax=Anopheles cruzii TaxID=68878 RepID=UPI0022EC542B|nr:putative gustatory receptor 2a [Anopheles cruzii]
MLPTLIFQLCGLQSFATVSFPVLSALALLWCTGNIVLYVGVLVFCVSERKWLFADPRHPASGRINFIPFIKSSITVVAHLLVLLEALLARNAYRAIDRQLRTIDGQLQRLTDSTASADLLLANRRYRNKLLVFVLFVCTTELGVLAILDTGPVQQAIWYLTVPSLFIIRLKHLHHTYHIDRLAALFGVLCRQLTSIVGGNTVGARDTKNAGGEDKEFRWNVLHRAGPSGWPTVNTSREVDSVRRMLRIESTYLALWHTVSDLNRTCVYSQLVNLLQNFIQCTCDLYTMYSLLYLNQFDDILGYILSIVATFAALGTLLAACENCKSQVSQMGQLLHHRNGDEVDLLGKMVENLSLLLQHTPLYFSLGGFFDMDLVLLKEMAAAIATYMVIFIQFMPKEDATAPAPESAVGNGSVVTDHAVA